MWGVHGLRVRECVSGCERVRVASVRKALQAGVTVEKMQEVRGKDGVSCSVRERKVTSPGTEGDLGSPD